MRLQTDQSPKNDQDSTTQPTDEVRPPNKPELDDAPVWRTCQSGKEPLIAAVNDFCAVFAETRKEKVCGMHRTLSAVHSLCAAIDNHKHGLSDDDLRDLLAPAARVHSRAPFVARLQTWPRGYPGDFETMEYLLDAKPGLAASNSHYWIEWYALNCAIAQQHRNKIEFQRQSIFRGFCGGRILSVGCGGARDLAGDYRFPNLAHVTLVDIDQAALALAQTRASWATSVETIHGDAVRALRQITGTYDRIVFGGLFDYLSDRAVISCLRGALRRSASKRTQLIFTNVSDSASGFLTWTSHMARWPLILRSPADIIQLVATAGLPVDGLELKRDATGLSLLCRLNV